MNDLKLKMILEAIDKRPVPDINKVDGEHVEAQQDYEGSRSRHEGFWWHCYGFGFREARC